MSTLLVALHRQSLTTSMAGIYIKSVSLAATRDPRHDVWLTINWAMPEAGAEIPLPGKLCAPGVTATVITKPADTVLRLPREMRSPSEIEDEILSIAWSLGAWDVSRTETAPLAAGENWREARYGIGSAFGHNPLVVAGQAILHGEAAPPAICEEAAQHGYVHWRFVPLAVASPTMQKKWQQKDRTLMVDCLRDGDPGDYRAEWRNPENPHTAAEHIYQMGRSNHGNRSKAAKDRRA